MINQFKKIKIMEDDKIKLNDLIEKPENYFIMLRPASKKRNDLHSVEINVEGYSDLFNLIMDLLKAGALALEGIEASEENVRDPEKYVASLLRVIEMLIPMEEGELLDILYYKHLNEKNETDSK
ncbi:hypothetical protein B0A63_25030 [Flavobacterium johnsoniae UW101]|uniref:Uncharacterized protein n=2 Tax=Flavobacterium johnsoniae TaxID=986 RepID=A5FDI2_FLAJ1|nr:hypothetical protein Fjoh_3717 [Flavobacterium johnsoniae UW101]OXE95242.1 hypothetical protein B0A63_25030 [Flavobacterium johnsoniae UW101]